RMVLGNPRFMHLRDTAATLFPELNGRLAAPNAVGKITIEVRTSDLGRIQTAFQSNVAAVVFLDRRPDGPARLIPVSAADAFYGLARGLPLIDQPMYEESREALRRLVIDGALELRYSGLEEAVRLLEPLTA
ncbi:MAG TPA: hypothetical protein VEU62_10490, partial [Bryobacterales bacterium]|nr:hypothetical protein [Bryobacterales bacterium]